MLRTCHGNRQRKCLRCKEKEAKKRGKRQFAMYGQWKLNVRKARDQLKILMPARELWSLIEELKRMIR